MKYQCYASAAFGLEGLVAAEIRAFHLDSVQVENGGVRFEASLDQVFNLNLRLHCCDRVFLLLAEKTCRSFEDLFQLVSSVPWQDYLAGTEAINVSAKCARSTLMSPRDCQSITKKAILEKLKREKHISVFPENGAAFPVLVSIHSDRCRILLNTSGESLSRRGYRTWNGEAPLRETLAASLISLSPWKPGIPFCDPACGSGTLLVEAAFYAAHRAPCLFRSFAMEGFSFSKSVPFAALREKAGSEVTQVPAGLIFGSDIDPDALILASRHIRQAGLEDQISVSNLPLQSLNLSLDKGVFVCNPPYGERLSDRETCHALYRDLRLLKERHPGWSLCAISSDPSFERYYGKKADRKRRLYNGRLECNFYIYY